MNIQSVWKQVERYQKAISQQERDDLLYQIGIALNIFTPREVERIILQDRKLTDEQKQLVLGFIEVYFQLNLSGF